MRPPRAGPRPERWRSPAARAALRELRRIYWEQGYRRALPDSRRQPGTHRGYELRFAAATAGRRDEVVRLLRALDIRAGRPFTKGPSWRVPVYGRIAVRKLLEGFGVR